MIPGHILEGTQVFGMLILCGTLGGFAVGYIVGSVRERRWWERFNATSHSKFDHHNWNDDAHAWGDGPPEVHG